MDVTTATWRGSTHDLVLLVGNLTVMTCICPREDLALTEFPLYDKREQEREQREQREQRDYQELETR